MELQQIAHDANHKYPLMIAIDQENGMLNNLYDKTYLTQFPGNMAIVATKSRETAKKVAEATGRELKALGINWILGPVVDVLSNSATRLLGVRTMGDDPEEVSEYALAFLEGYKAAGIATCGKHFPGYGNATVDSMLGLPIVPDSIEQLETASLIPFRKIIAKDIDSIMVGGCALPKVTKNEMHACLSEQVVQGMLRNSLHHNGVVVSECLEMKPLYENVGVRQGTVMAAMAGCDVIIVCSSYRLQLEAISGIFGAVRDEIIKESDVLRAADRVINMKCANRLTWKEALNPPPLSALLAMKKEHAALATNAYQQSITVQRDDAKYLPLDKSVEPDGDILLLTPLVSPIVNTGRANGHAGSEDVFKEFGRALAKIHTGKIRHASYTANGFMRQHDQLLDKAKAAIVVTTDANRNTYQVEFTRYVGQICSQQRKPMIAIAASSPYDLALDRGVGTYLCIYEFTQESLATTAEVLFGKLEPVGTFPGSGLYQNRLTDRRKAFLSRRKWLVEKWNCNRDLKRLKVLWESCFPDRRFGMQFDVFAKLFNDGQSADEMLDGPQTHFIVRNSSTEDLYGFCATWVHRTLNVGCIMMLFVAPSRRGMAIGQSLHERAINYLVKDRKVSTLRLGTRVPSFFEGIPLHSQLDRGITDNNGQPLSASLRAVELSMTDSSSSTSSINSSTNIDLIEWFRHAGWNLPSGRGYASDTSTHVHTMRITGLKTWSAPSALSKLLKETNLEFVKCNEAQFEALIQIVERKCTAKNERAGLVELYRKAFEPSSKAFVAVAVDRTVGTVVGGIIVFYRDSFAVPYMPWIVEFDDARVGGLCGLVVENRPGDAEGDAIAKQGLALLGLAMCKEKMHFDRCAITGIEGDVEARLMQECGFSAWRSCLEVSGWDRPVIDDKA